MQEGKADKLRCLMSLQVTGRRTAGHEGKGNRNAIRLWQPGSTCAIQASELSHASLPRARKPSKGNESCLQPHLSCSWRPSAGPRHACGCGTVPGGTNTVHCSRSG